MGNSLIAPFPDHCLLVLFRACAYQRALVIGPYIYSSRFSMKTYSKLYITDDGDPWAPNNLLKSGEKENHKLNRGGLLGECIGVTNNA